MSRSFVRRAYAVVAWLFVVCVVVQVFLAGLGVFDNPGSFMTHRDFGYTFGWLTLVLLALAFAGRVGRRMTGMSGLLLLQFALQSILIAFRTDAPAVAALHPVNGTLILVVAVLLARDATALALRPIEESPVVGEPGAIDAADAV